MITYNELYEALRKERYSEQLQPLPKSFLKEVFEYFNDKKHIASKEADLFSDTIIKTKKQLENAVSIFKELVLRRKKKLLNLAFIAAETGISKRDFDNMIDFEKELFDKIMKAINEAEKNLSDKMNGKKEENKNKLVTFGEDVGEFLGLSGETLGPFKKGEMANLPEEIVKILVDDKKAEFVDED
jgi:DNA replication initiation complex subunit (GINS family)